MLYVIFPARWYCYNIDNIIVVVVVQSLRHVWLFTTLWTAAHQAPLSFNISWSLLKFMFIESGLPSNHGTLCCSLLFAFSLSQHQGLFSELAFRIRWPKYWYHLPLGEGNGNPVQYSCLENPMDRGAWWATVHGVEKSRTWLSDFTFTFTSCSGFVFYVGPFMDHSLVMANRLV